MTDTKITIQLPSLIHRIGGENAKIAKQLATGCECQIKRIRRSRHWQITGEPASLEKLMVTLAGFDAEAMRFIVKKLESGVALPLEKPETMEGVLKRLVSQNPNVTLAELMQKTNCSISQARAARFAVDSF
ncbi:ribosome recycling factor family protein [Vibrio sp. Of7-15]|uniref:ribosome recycling factor family protein n=1 Tax=Vibrio sp. Of7-15 TaxID=2724879 RepID=UPI001EF16282|nr:ribosome recycling factor family protein [Vibrio sp. Of7-15]MCG7495275.1 ribosome recycling factor family protein [Vibrio sp. Of7-15]